MSLWRKRYEHIQIVSLLGWINSDSKDFNFEGWCKVDKNKPSRYINLDTQRQIIELDWFMGGYYRSGFLKKNQNHSPNSHPKIWRTYGLTKDTIRQFWVLMFLMLTVLAWEFHIIRRQWKIENGHFIFFSINFSV